MRKSLIVAFLGLLAVFLVGCSIGGDGQGVVHFTVPAGSPVGSPLAQGTVVIAQAATNTSAPVATPSATQVPDTATSPASNATPTRWVPPTALQGTPIPGAEATLTAAPALKTETITLVNAAGERSDMTVEVADTEPSRELGLMFRPSMDPDAGMLFDFQGDTTSGFWMANTILPLSIAFIQADGTIIDVLDMQPLDTRGIGASGPYRYALETNQGYFRAHNIAKGDRVIFPSQTSAVVIPGMPDCDQK